MPLLLTNLSYVAGLFAIVATCLLLLHLAERTTSRYIAHRLGWRAVLVTGWLGVPVHELAHLVAAWLFGHRIVNWSLLAPDPESGTLGYVRHAHTKRSTWQVIGYFFIAIAPAIAGGLALLLILGWMIPPSTWQQFPTQEPSLGPQSASQVISVAYLGQTAAFAASAIWQHRGPLLPLQLYLAICVACHLAPSRPDFRCAWRGLGVALSLSALAAGGCALADVSCAKLLVVGFPAAAIVLAAVLFQGLYVACVAALTRVASLLAGG